MGRPGFDAWGGKIPQGRAWQPTLVLLPGDPDRLRSLVGDSPQGHKQWDTTEQLGTAQESKQPSKPSY